MYEKSENIKKFKLYNHQVDAVNFICQLFGTTFSSEIQSRGAALLMEMGTGKTLTTIAVTGDLYRNGKIKRLLIVAPLSILGVWDDEFAKFADFDYSLSILTGSSGNKICTLHNMTGQSLQIAVINYESAWRLEKDLISWDADFIVADEGHKIKMHNIAAAKSMHRLGAKARYRLLLTGTVITNKALDVFSQYKFTNPTIFGTSFYSFRNRYFDMTGYGNHTPVLKKSMESDLTKRMHSIAFRATKVDCLDLPETTDIIQKVVLEPTAMDKYDSLVEESYAEFSSGEVTVTNVLTKLLRLSQLTGGFIGNDENSKVEQVSAVKLKAFEDIIDSASNENKKLVVIARFIPEINALCTLLEKKNIKYSLIKGGVKDREDQVSQFQTNPNVSVFVGQIATAGLGITLTAASIMVFYSLDYSMSNFEQAKARIHRVGQKNVCTYIYLTAKGTVDEKVLEALKSKANMAKMLVDDYLNKKPILKKE